MSLASPILKIMIGAAVVSTVSGYILAQQWLNQYAFRINVSVLHFFIPILFIGLLSAVLLILRSMKTISQNPVNYLRNE